METPGAHELADHPLVRLIHDGFHGQDDDPGRWDGLTQWLEEHKDEATPLLLQMAMDRSLFEATDLAGGELPIAATYFLGWNPDPGTIEPMLDLLGSMPRVYPEMIQWDGIWELLQAMPAEAVGPVIERYEASDDPERRALFAMLLGDLEVKDGRLQDIWIARLADHPCTMAAYLSLRGDKSALPALLETFDALEWNDSGEFAEYFAGQTMLDLCDAIASLAGELSPRQWDKYRKAWTKRAPTQPPPSIVPPPARKAFPSHRSWLPPADIPADTPTEFHLSALTIYGTVRNTASMIEMSPAMVYHYAHRLADVEAP